MIFDTFQGNVSGVLLMFVAVVFAGLACLLQGFGIRATKGRKELLGGISERLKILQKPRLSDLYAKRDELYRNKVSLEAQMSKKLDDQTAGAYRTVLDQIGRNIKDLETQLPLIEDSRKKTILYTILTFFCAGIIVLVLFSLFLA